MFPLTLFHCTREAPASGEGRGGRGGEGRGGEGRGGERRGGGVVVQIVY